MDALRSELYTALAEALADPPDWLALPGSQWPLVSIVRELGLRSSDACQAVEKMERIPAEPLEIRRERYAPPSDARGNLPLHPEAPC